ncbi:UPF0028 protein YchK [Hydrogenimonas sp.]|nr:UPF0028 protein YchK [Hydrogenimonas sp.]
MKLSLALSGGGVRAFAHLGVVKVLLDHGFEIGAVSGSSGGALIGALLCDGKSPEDVLSIMKDLRLRDLAGRPAKGGFFSLERIESLMQESLESQTIERLRIPFTVACTDLRAGSIRYFERGPVGRLSIASSSLVPIFSPVGYEDMLLADGGFMDNMPTKPLRKRGYPVIGINVNPIHLADPSGVVDSTLRVLTLMMAANIKSSMLSADFYIEPEGCGDINIFDLKKGFKAYEEGLKAAESSIGLLKRTLGLR